MRFGVIDGRASIIDGGELIDVAEASRSLFSHDAAAIWPVWSEFTAWAAGNAAPAERRPLPPDAEFGAPSPRPAQVLAIGVNYGDHAVEAGMELPAVPMVFAKFPSCITGASDPLMVTQPSVDWEAELVVVIGADCRDVAAADAWGVVAGLTVGQDISDRDLQFAASPPQFGLGKSRRGYGPTGPWLVTVDEFADPDDLAISCTLNGQTVQGSRTGELVHTVPSLIAYLSGIVELRAGDLIFTGTPSGVGFSRTSPLYLAAGDVLVTSIEGIGDLRTRIVGGPEMGATV